MVQLLQLQLLFSQTELQPNHNDIIIKSLSSQHCSTPRAININRTIINRKICHR